MDEYLIYIILASIVTIILGVLTVLRARNTTKTLENENEGEPVIVRPRPLPADAGVGGAGPRNRAVANRNARARMRVAQAQRQAHHSESEDEIEELADEIALPDGKIGKKKLAKLQMKAEKRATREADEREREEKKEREEAKAEQRREVEKEREEEEAKKAEEERVRKEEEALREREEYERMKAEFEVEEEGFDEEDDEERQRDLLNEFIAHIKKNKVVVLEDLAAVFKLKTEAVRDRIVELQKDGTLTGVIDDRGKFIYVSRAELESVAAFIRERGRVSISDLAEASNSLVTLTPDADTGVQA